MSERHGLRPEWSRLLRDLDRLQSATVEREGKRFTTPPMSQGDVGRVFQAVGAGLPPNMAERTG